MGDGALQPTKGEVRQIGVLSMSCGVCGRREVSGSCQDGYVVYLSGDYPCIFNKAVTEPRNLRVLPPLTRQNPRVIADTGYNSPEVTTYSDEGLEDLL